MRPTTDVQISPAETASMSSLEVSMLDEKNNTSISSFESPSSTKRKSKRRRGKTPSRSSKRDSKSAIAMKIVEKGDAETKPRSSNSGSSKRKSKSKKVDSKKQDNNNEKHTNDTSRSKRTSVSERDSATNELSPETPKRSSKFRFRQSERNGVGQEKHHTRMSLDFEKHNGMINELFLTPMIPSSPESQAKSHRSNSKRDPEISESDYMGGVFHNKRDSNNSKLGYAFQRLRRLWPLKKDNRQSICDLDDEDESVMEDLEMFIISTHEVDDTTSNSKQRRSKRKKERLQKWQQEEEKEELNPKEWIELDVAHLQKDGKVLPTTMMNSHYSDSEESSKNKVESKRDSKHKRRSRRSGSSRKQKDELQEEKENFTRQEQGSEEEGSVDLDELLTQVTTHTSNCSNHSRDFNLEEDNNSGHLSSSHHDSTYASIPEMDTTIMPTHQSPTCVTAFFDPVCPTPLPSLKKSNDTAAKQEARLSVQAESISAPPGVDDEEEDWRFQDVKTESRRGQFKEKHKRKSMKDKKKKQHKDKQQDQDVHDTAMARRSVNETKSNDLKMTVEEFSAIQIQSIVRRFFVRARYGPVVEENLDKFRVSVLTIQCWMRCCLARSQHGSTVDAKVRIWFLQQRIASVQSNTRREIEEMKLDFAKRRKQMTEEYNKKILALHVETKKQQRQQAKKLKAMAKQEMDLRQEQDMLLKKKKKYSRKLREANVLNQAWEQSNSEVHGYIGTLNKYDRKLMEDQQNLRRACKELATMKIRQHEELQEVLERQIRSQRRCKEVYQDGLSNIVTRLQKAMHGTVDNDNLDHSMCRMFMVMIKNCELEVKEMYKTLEQSMNECDDDAAIGSLTIDNVKSFYDDDVSVSSLSSEMT